MIKMEIVYNCELGFHDLGQCASKKGSVALWSLGKKTSDVSDYVLPPNL